MGINSFFTYTICLGAGVPWQEALGMVFVNGAPSSRCRSPVFANASSAPYPTR